MSLAVIIILIVIGIIMLILEVLVVPGGVLGILALGMIGFGVYSAYARYGTTTGHITLAVAFVATAGAVIISLKSVAWKRLALHDELTGRANEIDGNLIQVGSVGITVSDLRPMGTALFGDEKFEVSSEGEKIPVHTRIAVIRIEGNKIIIQKTEN